MILLHVILISKPGNEILVECVHFMHAYFLHPIMIVFNTRDSFHMVMKVKVVSN